MYYNAFPLLHSARDFIRVTSSNSNWGRIIQNPDGSEGNIYIQVSVASTPTRAFRPRLYSSFDGYQWFFNTAFGVNTAGATVGATTGTNSMNKMFRVPNLTGYVRLQYDVKATALGVRAFLETKAKV